MGLALAGVFAWAAVRTDALEVTLSTEQLKQAEIMQMLDRLDVILTAADLTLSGGETYTAQWAADRSTELAESIRSFRATYPLYFDSPLQKQAPQQLERLAQLILREPSDFSNDANMLREYDQLALSLITTGSGALDHANQRVIAAREARDSNIGLVIISLVLSTFGFLAASLFSAQYATKRIIRPLEILGAAALEERAIQTDAPSITGAPEEVVQLASAFADLTKNLSSRVQERTAQLEATTNKLRTENDRRRRVELDLQKALEDTRRASASKTAFLSVMSHELRTPMNAVLGALHIIKGEHLSENQKQLLGTAQDAGDFLISLLTDVLDISKIDSDGVEIKRSPTHLASFIQTFERQIKVQVSAADCEWRLSMDNDLPDYIEIDPNRVQQVLTNFVGNACKFAPASPLHLSVESTLMLDRKAIRFALTDKGPGISQEDQQTIFEPFNQVQSSLDRSAGGVGLGLSICKRLAAAMGGRCGVKSEVSQGATFFIEIPCIEVARSTIDQSLSYQPQADRQQIADKEKLKLLLVEESEVK